MFPADQIEDAIKAHDPKLVAAVHGDTSTTMAQPLADIGEVCRSHDRLLYADATATLPVDPIALSTTLVDLLRNAELQKP